MTDHRAADLPLVIRQLAKEFVSANYEDFSDLTFDRLTRKIEAFAAAVAAIVLEAKEAENTREKVVK